MGDKTGAKVTTESEAKANAEANAEATNNENKTRVEAAPEITSEGKHKVRGEAKVKSAKEVKAMTEGASRQPLLASVHAYLLLSDDWSTGEYDVVGVTYESLRRRGPCRLSVPFDDSEQAHEIVSQLIAQIAKQESRKPEDVRWDLNRIRSMTAVRRGPFDSLRDGHQDPDWGYHIETLIMSRPTFVVYISKKNLDVIWRTADDYPRPAPDFGVAMNRLTLLKAEPIAHLAAPIQRTFRELLGEGAARLLEDNSIANVMPFFDKVEMYLRARNSEFSRRTYLFASLVSMTAFVTMAVVVWLEHRGLDSQFTAGFSATVVSAMMGAVGAFLSVFYRLGDQPLDARAGRSLLELEGCLRVIVGVLAAMVVGWAIRSNFITGASALFQTSMAAPLLLGALAGASERLVPTLVTKLERTAGAAQLSDSTNEPPAPPDKGTGVGIVGAATVAVVVPAAVLSGLAAIPPAAK